MAISTIEERLAVLEEKVDRIAAEREPRPEDAPWWKKIVGIYKDDPEFDAVERLGREYRESLRPPDYEEVP